MQPIQFFAARAEDGALLPGATVDVLVHGTQERARLFSDSPGTIPLENPAHSDANARVFFYTTTPRIDIRISRYGYVAPLLVDISTLDAATAVEQVQAKIDEAINKIGDSLVEMEREFKELYERLGFEPIHLIYGAGVRVDRATQLIERNGELYRATNLADLPLTLTGTWTTDAPKLTAVGDLALRQDLLIATKGASLVGWLQAGLGSISRTVTTKLRESVSINDFGGSDDNAIDNGPAFAKAKTFVGSGGVFRLVRRAAAILKFTTPVDLNNVVINNDPNMVLSLTEAQFPISGSQNVSVLRRLRLYFSNQNYNYDLYPEHSEDLAEKRVWLDQSAADLSYGEGLDLSALRHEYTSWPNGSDWTPATNYVIGSNGADWPFVNWSAGAGATWYRSSFGVRIGDEVCVSFSTGGRYNRAAFIQHATGYIALYATGVNGDLVYVQKLNGQSPVTNPVAIGDVFTTQIQYYAENSEWRIKILSKRKFVILFNGIQVAGILTAPSDIMRAGFGYMPQDVADVAISNFVRTRNAKRGGVPAQAITIYGDSTSADIHGAWSYALRKALDGMGGIVVESVTNLAVPGFTSGEMLARVQALGFNGGTAIFLAGTNDIQGSLSVQQYLKNMRDSFQLAIDAGQLVIAFKPVLWYTQAEAQAAGAPLGTGQASGNAKGGADYRTGLERLCANMGIKLLDLTQISGPVNAKYLIPRPGVIADSLMRDNIHWTAYLYKLIGVGGAKAVFGAVSGLIQRQAEVQSLPVNYSAGWTFYPSLPEVPQMYWTEDRRLDLLGKISGPTTGGTLMGAQVGQLREDLWPVVPFSAPISYSGGNCKVYVSLTGIISVDNYVAAPGSYLDLSSIHLVTKQ